MSFNFAELDGTFYVKQSVHFLENMVEHFVNCEFNFWEQGRTFLSIVSSFLGNLTEQFCEL